MISSRKDVEKEYEVKDGIITSKGKFEDQPIYAPYIYDLVLDGSFEDDEDEDGVVFITLIDEDKEEFPELKDFDIVKVKESEETGFITVKAEKIQMRRN